MAKHQKKHFDRIASKYLDSRSNRKHLNYKYQWWSYIYRKIEGYLPKKEEIVCLDAMCGNAELSIFLSNKISKIKIEAFDYSKEMVEAARRMAKGNSKISITQKDILKLKNKNKYDLIIIAGGLHHIPNDVAAALKKVFLALKPNGLLLNIEPTHNNFLWRIVRQRLYRSNDLFDANSEKAFRLKDYNNLLRRQGFKVMHQNYPGLLGYVLYYNPDAFPKLNIDLLIKPRMLSKLDLLAGSTWIGKYLSFATLTIASK